jgi:hypothetical protein
MARTNGLVFALLLAGVAGMGMASCADDSATVRPVTDTTVRRNLTSAARSIAQRAGVETPASIVAVAAADHQAAEAVVSGAILADHDPVYVVQMTGGTFTSPHHPHGRPAPQGNVLTVTFRAATLEVTDVGYDSVAPDLTKIDAQPVDLLATGGL